jgi:hypothetical protein
MFLEFYLFYVFGEMEIVWVRGTKHFISFDGGGGIKNFPTLFGGCQILW